MDDPKAGNKLNAIGKKRQWTAQSAEVETANLSNKKEFLK